MVVLTIRTELEAVPGLLTVTSRALVPLCMLNLKIANGGQTGADRANWIGLRKLFYRELCRA